MGTVIVICPPTSTGAGLVTGDHTAGGCRLVADSKWVFEASAGQPKVREPDECVTVIWKASTTVLMEAVLLAFNGSVTAELTVAVFVNVPGAVGATVNVTLVCPPLPRFPRLAKITLLPESAPPEEADTKFTVGGSVSVSARTDAVAGPWLVIVKVYVRLYPVCTGSAEPIMLRIRSAVGKTI